MREEYRPRERTPNIILRRFPVALFTHAAALAVAGWLLIGPPQQGGPVDFNVHALFRQVGGGTPPAKYLSGPIFTKLPPHGVTRFWVTSFWKQ